MIRSRFFRIPSIATSLMMLVASASPQEFPSKFVTRNAAAGKKFNIPVAIAIAPGNRIFVAEKKGKVSVIDNGKKVSSPFVSLENEVLSNESNGLLGVAVDPDFDNNPWVYLLYVVDPTGGQDDDKHAFSRLTRYRAKQGDLNAADLSSRQVLIGKDWADGIIACSGQHVIGGLRFGSDGTLLLTSGEASVPSTVDAGGGHPECFGHSRFDPAEDIGAFRSQYLGSLSGKLLRIDRETGLGLPSNPYFTGDPSDKQSKVWAYGLRNPYRFGIRPDGSSNPDDGKPGTVYLGDVGWGQYEEVSVARGGENFGWPCYEGPRYISKYGRAKPKHGRCSTIGSAENPSEHVPPIIHWHHTEPGKSNPKGLLGNCVTGGVFYSGHHYPNEYRGKYFVADYEKGWIKTVEVSQNDKFVALEDFAQLPGGRFEHGVVDLVVHPETGDLLYVDVATERVIRVEYTGAQQNQPPVARATSDVSSGKAPLTVRFTASDSFDPNGDSVTFLWEFGNGDQSIEADPVYTYTTPGTFTATLIVEDPAGLADTFFLEIIVGSEPPVPTILSPANGASFFPHETVALQGSASDPDEPESSLQFEWEIDLHHNDHIHPATQNFAGSIASIIPEDHGDPWDLIYLAIKLRVTDSSNLAREAVSYVVMKSEGEKDITDHGTPTALITNPSGSGNLSIDVIQDGVYPAVGSTDPSLQYDTQDGSPSRPEDWIGYEFQEKHRFGKLIFQEGMHFEDGGWFNSLQVQVRTNGSWQDVAFLNSVPPYPGENNDSYEIFSLLFSPQSGDAIRIIGSPGGTSTFISVAELRAIETPFEPPQPVRLILNPSHDSFVRENRASKNYGTENELRIRKTNSARQIGYIKFDVTGVTGEVTQAVLRLYCLDGSDDGGTIHTVSNDYHDGSDQWQEDKLTWNNAPTIKSAAIYAMGSVVAGDPIEADVTGLIVANGTYSFAIANQSSNKAGFFSRETALPPELIIDFDAPPVSTPEPEIISFTPGQGTVGTHVQIIGNYLSELREVRFGDTVADHAHVLSDSEVEAEVPLGATTGPISITTHSGTTVSLEPFIVETNPAPPVISSFNPVSGPTGIAVTIDGDHLGSATQVSFSGVASAQISVVSNETIVAVVPDGSSTGPIAVTNELGTTTTEADFTVVPADTVKPITLHFIPTDDSFVWSKKPANNYAADTSLRVRQTSSADQIAYFKFHIQGIDGNLTKATLRLFATDGSNDGGSVHLVSNSYHGTDTPWEETGLQWPNAPRVQSSAIASVGAVKAGGLAQFDITASISGDGSYSYAVSNGSSDVVHYNSKEATIPPELIIEVETGSTAANFSPPSVQDRAAPTQSLEIPESVVLSANYPNPFNIATKIQYGLPKATLVRLGIYNIQGQRIRTLVDSVQPAGFKSVRWDGSNDLGLEVSSGIYFARLRTQDTILTIKLLLQK